MISALGTVTSHKSFENVTNVGPPGGASASRNARRKTSGIVSADITSQVHCA